jgi:hypothetical protein
MVMVAPLEFRVVKLHALPLSVEQLVALSMIFPLEDASADPKHAQVH